MITDPRRLLALYERGVITESELTVRLVGAAAESAPAEIAATLPPEVLGRVQANADMPKNTRWVAIRSVCNAPGVSPADIQAAEERERQRWLDGLDRWRVFFAMTDPATSEGFST